MTNAEYGEYLRSSYVLDGNLVFSVSSNISANDLREIYDKLSEALLSALIPNWRVIGFLYQRNSNEVSVLRDNELFHSSLIELSLRMNNIVLAKGGGDKPEKGRFLYIDQKEAENEHPNMLRYRGVVTSGSRGKTLNILKANSRDPLSKNIGAIMFGPTVASTNNDLNSDDDARVTEMFSDSPWYCQADLKNAIFPQYLIGGKKICDLDHACTDCCLTMFIKKGTRNLHYRDTQRYFIKEADRIMPCNTSYDLSRFFSIAMPSGSGNSLKLCYFEDSINERVLTSIFNNYGSEVLENEHPV